jgi:1,5-anhydro-D-fructose reductase (1,5-anhydro-D-mannitol-forming)
MTQLGWGIVGLGRIADTEIAPAVTELANSRLVAVASRDQGRADKFAARHGGPVAVDDYAALLRRDDVDAVYIATPNGQHAEQVCAAALAGKHVLCDKPLATSQADAEQAIAACRNAGVGLGVTFQSRRFQGMAEIRDAIAAGQVGRAAIVQLEMGAGRNPLAGWRTDPALAGLGTINNIGAHGYDLLRYLLGSEVVQVAGMLGFDPAGPELDTTALALLRFADGALAYVNANQAVPESRADLVVHGERGRIELRNGSRPNRLATLSTVVGGEVRDQAVDTSGAYQATVRAFADAVLAGRDPEPSGADGLACLRIAEAVAESWNSGRFIDLALTPPGRLTSRRAP